MLTKINRVWAIVVLIAATMGMTSCLKNNVDTTPQRPTFWLNVANLSTYSGTMDLYDNGKKITNSGISGFFTEVIGGYSGPHEMKVTPLGKDSVLATASSQLDSLHYYTYMIYGGNPVKAALVESNLTNYSPTSINLRFYNLSSSVGPVDVYMGSKKVFENVVYADGYFRPDFTTFTDITEGNVITVKKAGTTEVVATNNSLKISSLQTGGVYTAYVTGNAGSTGNDKPSTNIIYGAY
ncbi:protein of unknown function [Chitinophaga jiangningensis]|uniref:DUF4397 domain-containing protein n=1 Tax=Chitinophaga jiangningensis TaxID=1419482 RepID=A0A1M6YNN7_9BACT|nr:DUF4397 domain-containing protein [Chitinophaga jiangningensis]SHL19858.1 protein of unknown function [Chitinophaga jiangningensis]